MWLSKRPRRIFYKRRQSQTAQEILDRLRDYLDNQNSEPVEILSRFWQDQQTAISYQELRAIVQQGYLDEISARLWEQDYSLLVTERLPKIWTDAMIAGSVSQPCMEHALSAFTFNTQTPGVVEWIRSRGAYLVTECTQTQKDAIALLLEDKMRNSHTVDELAKLIRPTIGLTKQQTAAARNFYDNMVKTLTEQHPRTKPETLQARALEQTAKYAERLHRQRAVTIAQTEMAYAYNYGADEGIRQAQADYLIGKCIKKWCTSGDEGVCEECEKLDGMEIGMEEQFFSGNKVEYDESGLFPPLHPRCGCAVEYIEVEAPNFSLQNPLPNVSMDQGISSMNELTRNADGTYTITEEPITDISIERVSKIAPTGWSDEMATRLQDANRKLLADARQYPTGTETATVYSMDFSVCSQTVVGTYGAVNIPVLDEPYIGIHNHPDGLVFSPADIINFFSRNSMNALVAVGNNGSAYLMQKMSEYDAVKAFDAFGLVKQDMDKAVAAGDPQALVNVIENFLREAKKYGVEFISGS